MASTQKELRAHNDAARNSDAVNRMMIGYEEKISILSSSVFYSRALAVVALIMWWSTWH